MADPTRRFRNAPDGAVEVFTSEPGPYSYSAPKELVVMRFSPEDVAEIRKLTEPASAAVPKPAESAVEILDKPKPAAAVPALPPPAAVPAKPAAAALTTARPATTEPVDHPVEYPTGPGPVGPANT